MRIVLAGGGTAGHIFPTLAVAAELRALLGSDTAHLAVVCGARELDATLYRDTELDLIPLPVRGLIGAGWRQLPWRLARMCWCTVLVWRELGRRRPQAIVASGGYVSVPLILAGRLRGTPVVLFSGDAQLGWATRVLAPLARITTIAFDAARAQLRGTQIVPTGYPLRAEFGSPDPQAGRRLAGCDPDDQLLLVMGGSQGAHTVNQAILRDLPRLVERGVLFHLTGRAGLAAARAAAERLPDSLRARYQAHAFVSDGFANLLAAADLVVSRAGATSVAELSAVGTAAIIVPGEFGAGHQVATAHAMQGAGAAVVVRETELAKGRLAQMALELLSDSERLAAMQRASRARGRPGAAREIARIAIELGRSRCPQVVPNGA